MRNRLFVSFIAIVVTTVVALLIAIQTNIGATFDDFRGAHIGAHLQHVPQELSAHYQPVGSWDGIGPVLEHISTTLNMEVGLVDVDDNLVAATSLEISDIAFNLDVERADLAVEIKDPASSAVVGTAFFRSSPLIKQRDQLFLQQLYRVALWVGLSVLGLAVLLSYWLSNTISKPLNQLSQAAANIPKGHYDIAVDRSSDPEIDSLVVALTHMGAEIGKLEKMRRNLVTNISHDLRTPLTVVNGYLEGLRNGAIADRRTAEKVFEIMHTEIQYLTTLVESLNEVAALDSGEIPLNYAVVSVRSLVRQAVDRIRPNADLHSIRVHDKYTHIDQDTFIKVDPVKFGQALFNLLDNALHYSPPDGRLCIAVTATESELCFAVKDRGDGVLPEHQPFIFERFYRADPNRNRKQHGYGMGLSIVRSVVHAHGGRVWVDSSGVPGEETVFTIALPIG